MKRTDPGFRHADARLWRIRRTFRHTVVGDEASGPKGRVGVRPHHRIARTAKGVTESRQVIAKWQTRSLRPMDLSLAALAAQGLNPFLRVTGEPT